jgi:hypothetical protein
MPKSPKSQSAASSAKKQPANKSASHTGRHPEKKQSNRTSKRSRVIAMLRSPNGATIPAMMKATDWQKHSVRGFLAGVIRKRLKLKLESQAVDGKRLYRIVGTPAKPITAKHRSV